MERLLRVAGHDVQVWNAGVSGDTFEAMLARLDRYVPDGMRVVILQGGYNDLLRRSNPAWIAGYIQAILSRLRARKIAVVLCGFFYPDWDKVGMARNEEGLKQAIDEIRRLRDEFWQDVSVPGEANNLNQGLDYAGRVADYMEFAEVLALDALERRESCGGHFREEYQTPDGEAQRNDDEYTRLQDRGQEGRDLDL